MGREGVRDRGGMGKSEGESEEGRSKGESERWGREKREGWEE